MANEPEAAVSIDGGKYTAEIRRDRSRTVTLRRKNGPAIKMTWDQFTRLYGEAHRAVIATS